MSRHLPVNRWLHNLSVATRRGALRVILAVPDDLRARLAQFAPLVWVYELFDRAKYQPLMDADEYRDWVRQRREAGRPAPRYTEYRYATPQRTPAIAAEMAGWAEPPLVSVLMPAWNSEPGWLRAAVASLQAQWYPHWELCIADDHSDRDETLAALAALDDPRIRVTRLPRNGGIVAASNAALALARGEFVALMDHDDELTPDALYQCVRAILGQGADFVYSDEDKLEPDGRSSEPHFKPDWAPDQFLAQNYLSHLGVIRRSLVTAVDGFSAGTDGAQDYDLYLKVLEHTDRIAHVPRVLYHWRKVPGSTAAEFGAKSHAQDAGAEALRRALARRGEAGEVLPGRYPGTYRVRHALRDTPLVSIVVPFRDQPQLTRQCIEAVLEHSSYPHFELIGISNGSEAPETASMMEELAARDPRVAFHDDDRPFNFAAINNRAVSLYARGEQLVLMNNDIEVINPDWLEALLEYAQRDDVGVTGGCLYYPDGRFQHAGIILGIGGVAGHSHKYVERSHHGYFSRPHIAQNVSAVTAALWMVRRVVWDRLGGLDEANLAIAFNDVDFCLRAREHGYLNVYTPWCEAWHHESVSRGYESTPEKKQRFAAEVEYMTERHAAALAAGDPYYNPNLTLHHEDFSFAPPPDTRRKRAGET